MAFKFDTNPFIAALSTQNLRYLIDCEKKMIGVQAQVDTPERLAQQDGNWAGQMLTQDMADREIARLEKVRKDIVKRLTKDEKKELKAYIADAKPKELSDEERAAVIRKFDENRDKESI